MSKYSISQVANKAIPTQPVVRERVLAYYTSATTDYLAWSQNYNMHFGYWRKGLNPLLREPMLQELNLQVFSRLGLPKSGAVRLADFGGGTGATARAAVAAFANLSVDVITIVPLQIEIAQKLNAAVPRGDAITMHCVDFSETQLSADQFDAVYMIESACHAAGATKQGVLREAFRLLKPGGRFVMTDAMLLHELPTAGLLSRLVAYLYHKWCESWAIPEMCRKDLLHDAMKAEGFDEVHIEDWRWQVAPSIAHIPLLVLSFTLAELFKARGLLPLWRWRHIVASFLTPLLALRMGTFTYGAAIATKPVASPPISSEAENGTPLDHALRSISGC